MLVGSMVCYEPYIGCNSSVLKYGHILRIDESSCTVLDREGVEIEVNDLSCVFEVDKFPLRCKRYLDSIVYENGEIYSTVSGKKRQVFRSRGKSTWCCKFANNVHNGAVTSSSHSIGRVLYYLFVEEFDIKNPELQVRHKNGDQSDFSLDNLELMSRDILVRQNASKGAEARRNK